jgi:adenylate kinase
MLAEEGVCVTKVIELHVPDSILEEWICGRWMHKASGGSYHVKFAPSKCMKLKDSKPLPDTMKDDITGEPLMQCHSMIQILEEDTYPILNHYQPKGIIRSMNANQGMNAVWEDVLQALLRKPKAK